MESTLLQWMRIASVAAEPERADDVQASAAFCADLLTEAGLDNVEIIEGHGGPAVYGDSLSGGIEAPTVLVYGYHDVAPVGTHESWSIDPFLPDSVDGICRGRGAASKGQVLLQIEAIRGMLKQDGLPANVKLLIEGDATIGSPHLVELVEAERRRLACDFLLSAHATMWSTQQPTITIAQRGVAAFEVSVRSAASEVHGGRFGGAIPNPTHVLSLIVSELHDTQGRVSLPGFYHRVKRLSPQQQTAMDQLTFDDAAWLTRAGVTAPAGEVGQSTRDRVTIRPACDVVSMHAGTSHGIGAVVPGTATAMVVFLLVPDQRPSEIEAAFRSWIEARIPAGIHCEIRATAAHGPARSRVDHPGIEALGRSIRRIWGTKPVLAWEGTTGPQHELGEILAAPIVFFGVGLPDDRLHGPNEHLTLDQLSRGVQVMGEFWHEIDRKMRLRGIAGGLRRKISGED